jgi:hypothetical protein
LAQEEDLLVLLRPGPYICAERDMVWSATIIGSKNNWYEQFQFHGKGNVDFQNIDPWLSQNNYSALFDILLLVMQLAVEMRYQWDQKVSSLY